MASHSLELAFWLFTVCLTVVNRHPGMFLPRLGVLYNYEHVPSSPYIMVDPQLKPLSRLFPIPSVQCTHIPRTFSPGKSRLQFFSLLYRMIAVWGVPLSAFFGAWCLPTLFAEYELQLRGQSFEATVLCTPYTVG